MTRSNRRRVLSVLVLVGSACIGASAFQQPPAGRGRGLPPAGPPVIEVERLKENLFVLRGGGGNTAAFVVTNGVILVDRKIPGWGQPLIEKVRELTDKPITTLINTHTHFDHAGGNPEFPATIDIVAHENTKANMEKGPPPKGFEQLAGPDVFKANNGKNIAKRTFKDRMSIGSGNDRVDLYFFGRGHTNGDAWVVFPLDGVMHAGDIFSGKTWPILDSNNGGSAVEMFDTLAKAADVKGVSSIITGHSTIMTVADLKEYAEFNRDFLNDVRAAKKAGRSVEDVVNTWKIAPRYKGYQPPPAERLRANVQMAYDELK
jgi:glyoxylase-like metal-dependent hydrolase (beta-lactamase superfamily II)